MDVNTQLKLENLRLKKALLEAQGNLLQLRYEMICKEVDAAEAAAAPKPSPPSEN